MAAAIAAVWALAGCVATTNPDAGGSAAPTAPAISRPAAPEGELSAELQSELTAALEGVMAQYDVPGAAAGVWIPGQGSWTTAVGMADIESDPAVTTDMSWPIRSITTSYTVTLILQLADEGVLSLDDTIDQYVEGSSTPRWMRIRSESGIPRSS